MKTCHCCTAQLEDNALYCRNCGAVQSDEARLPLQPVPQPEKAAEKLETDHTEEFSPDDIGAHKLYAMCVYLLDIGGIAIALLGAKDSPYTMFHVRQGLKFTVIQALLAAAAALLCWTFLVPIAAAICLIVLTALRLASFVQVCRGMAKEPAILHKFGFLN